MTANQSDKLYEAITELIDNYYSELSMKEAKELVEDIMNEIRKVGL